MSPDRLAAALAARLRDGAPPNIAVMHLLMASPSPEAAEAAGQVAIAIYHDLAEPLAAVMRLLVDHPGAWGSVHAVVDTVEHGPGLASMDATLSHWRDSFDRLAAVAPETGVALYALGDPGLFAAATDEVVAHLLADGLLGADRDALDLGCGMGRFAEALAPEVRSVLGLDLSAGMVAEARLRTRHHNVRFEVGAGRGLNGVADLALDLVLAADVFPYLVEAGLADRHVAEIARVLRPGGTAVVLNYSYRGDAARDLADLTAAAQRHGLGLERRGERPFRLWDAALFTLVKRAGGPSPHRTRDRTPPRRLRCGQHRLAPRR